jgi:hypothetical protein
MHRPSASPRPPAQPRRRLPLPLGPIAFLACLAAAGIASAADLPGDLLGRFTRGVQPLLLNKCATGACHGGATAHEPRLRRPDLHGGVDRAGTLANLDTFLTMLGPDRDPQPLIDLLAVQHPRNPQSRRLVMKPLSAAERVTLESWIVALQDAERTVRPARHETPAEPVPPAPRPNRFRVLLDTGLPPPASTDRQPTGRSEYTAIIDRRQAAGENAVTPESAPPAPPRETDDSPPERPDARASPQPTSTGSR